MNKEKNNIIFNLYIKFFAAFLILLFVFIGLTIYLLKVNVKEGSNYFSWSSAPIQYTSSFSKYIVAASGKPSLTKSGINELNKNKLSIQIVDKNGDVAFSLYEHGNEVHHYSPIDIIELYKDGGSKNHTRFLGSTTLNGEKLTYIISYPVKISKITLYLSGDKASNIKFIILGLLVIFLILIAIYSIRVSSFLSKLIWSIKKLATNEYVPYEEKGLYEDVYKSLNFLDKKLKLTDAERKRDEVLREEWVANISHDLKTPLSPIKGYAEILSDSKYEINLLDVRKYGKVILRNVKNVETLVENLNFTYQLKNGMLPINKKEGNLIRLLKEVIISILNRPEYENRTIEFIPKCEIVNYNFDPSLLERAFTNLLYNSLTHNRADTKIQVTIDNTDKISIEISDNGVGMEEELIKNLFNRYYRGTNTHISVKGSGLGMAIAKEIIEVHKGTISVKSKINEGTTFIIEFPKN